MTRAHNHDEKQSASDKLLASTRAWGQSPRSQRQTLQLGGSRLDEHEESNRADEHAQHVGDVIPVTADLTDAATVNTAVLLGLEGAGKGRGDEGVFQSVGGRSDGGWDAGGLGEEVDELEDEVAGEGTTQVGDAKLNWLALRKEERLGF